jgi:hypothetical protein
VATKKTEEKERVVREREREIEKKRASERREDATSFGVKRCAP